jgi:ribonuclease G
MKKILINDNLWQARIAIVHNDKLENLYFKTHSAQSLERSYFKGLVSKVLPGIQTAFVNIGQEKAGFLHISEIDRELAIKRMGEQLEELEEAEHFERPEPMTRRELDISKILKEGETILVQVSKEPVYEKGAKLTTCFTLPGRFLVLMPNIPRIGISKKIEDREERQRLRELVTKHLPEGMGAIIRTSSDHKPEHEILQDLTYLLDTWNFILKRYKEAQPEEKLYEDIDITLQVIRDYLDNDVELVLCDTQESHQRVYKFVKHIAPEYASKVRLYEGPPSLFEKFGLEKQIEQALEKKVYLKSGGSLIIETTEAMTVIDVNTGRYTGQSRLEETILKTNLDAAEEIVRQLRLRNIGGLIVIDFIDMSSSAHRQKLYRFLEKTLKEHDKFQSVVLKVSEFGLVQMTRKRSGKTLMQQMTEVCMCCHGLGSVKSTQTEAFAALRKLKDELERKRDGKPQVTLLVHPAVLEYITSVEYNSILALEKEYKCKIMLSTHDNPHRDTYTVALS